MSLPGCVRISCAGQVLKRLARPYTTAGRDLDRSFQSYISTSRDPYLNLSIEHHLLQKASKSSVILFLYVNRPCVVIGRNQNPWTEVNLPLLVRGSPLLASNGPDVTKAGAIDLVRRRSGGGTVFHDSGNVNWTVISPAEQFTRDKHAEMVTRALRNCGIQRCRVNERHDIVLDQGGTSSVKSWGPKDDTHQTPWRHDAERTVKVSGSAYKLTRGRALHHGTALLNSPHLKSIHDILTAPGRGFIESKGVASVSSPVANIGLDNDNFIKAVQDEFWQFYDQQPGLAEEIGESWHEDRDVQKGFEELVSHDWTYLQTPRFSVEYEKQGLRGVLHARNGRIETLWASIGGSKVLNSDSDPALTGQTLYEIHDWREMLGVQRMTNEHQEKMDNWALWLQRMLPHHQNRQNS